MATIGILNVGAGDTKLTFDKRNPAECIRAARIVKDMLRRGYALLVDTGKKDESGRAIHARAFDFDENTPACRERAITLGGSTAILDISSTAPAPTPPNGPRICA